MSTKKRKPLGSAMEEFVFGTKEKEAAPPPTPDVVSPAPPASQAAEIPQTPITPEATLPVAKPPQVEASTSEPVRIQSKGPSLMSKLQVPDKEATVRFTVDMSESLHHKLSMLAKTGRKKVDIVRMLLEDGLKETDG